MPIPRTVLEKRLIYSPVPSFESLRVKAEIHPCLQKEPNPCLLFPNESSMTNLSDLEGLEYESERAKWGGGGIEKYESIRLGDKNRTSGACQEKLQHL